jgi:hypothetical protein
MPASLEHRSKDFSQGVPFILLPAVLIIPALRFVAICPPSYGKFLGLPIVVIFAASELWGVVKMFRCFIGKWDLTAIGSIFCSVIGLAVLLYIFGVCVLAMRSH